MQQKNRNKQKEIKLLKDQGGAKGLVDYMGLVNNNKSN